MIFGKRWPVGREPLRWVLGGGALATSLGVLGIACDDATELEPLPHGPVPEVCEPAEIRSCYDGPAGTEGVGICSAGTQTCADHGRAWGPCEGVVFPQPEDCATEDDEDCDGVLTCGETVRSLRFGVGRDEVAWDVGLDGDDHIYLTGFYRDPIDFGGGDLPTTNARRDVFVAKLSPEGEYGWSHGLYGDDHYTPRGLAVAPDGTVAVLASFSGTLHIGSATVDSHGGNDVLIAVFDADGTIGWSAAFGDSDHQHALGATFDPAGNLWVTGYFAGEIDFGGEPLTATTGSSDVFVAKLAPEGEHLFSTAYPGLEEQYGAAVAAGPDGAIYVVGHYTGEIDFGQGIQAASGDDQDVFVLKLDEDGQTEWSRTYGDEAQQQAYAVAVDSSAEVAVVGRLEGSIDFGAGKLTASGGGAAYLVKLDAEGNHLFSQLLGGPANAGATDVAFDSRDRVLVTGYYEGSLQLGHTPLPESGVYEPSIFLSKLEPWGTFVWSRGIKVHGDQSAWGVSRAWRSIAIGSEDQAVLAGFVRNQIDFGDGETTGEGGADLFAVWLEP